FAHGHEHEALHDLAGALGFRIEGLDALDGVAEEVQADGRGAARWIEIDEAAAYRELAGLHDRARAHVAGARQTLDEPRAIDALAGRHGAQRPAQKVARGDALENG